MDEKLYSVRMHASREGRHLSGGERIVPEQSLESVVAELLSRAKNRPEAPDSIVLNVDNLPGEALRRLAGLDLVTLAIQSVDETRQAAVRILRRSGISEPAALGAIHALTRGPSPSGEVMRGAMIMDATSGIRLEPDQARGIRASRFDWTDEAFRKVRQDLASAGLVHHRTREALALAAKVANGPGVVAELCWSDDPVYTAGYVASRETGYVRFPHLKAMGDPKGGRVFFVRREDLNLPALIRYLEEEPVLIDRPGACRAAQSASDFFRTML